MSTGTPLPDGIAATAVADRTSSEAVETFTQAGQRLAHDRVDFPPMRSPVFMQR